MLAPYHSPVIIRNLNIISIMVSPNKTDAILIIDAYAVLPMPVSMQLLWSIARRQSEIAQIPRRLDHRQLSLGNVGGRRSFCFSGSPNLFCF
jgi:hypothetical protein